MSVEDLIRATIDRYNERGIEGLLEYATDDVVWHAPPEYPEGLEWQGREALAQAWHDQFGSVFEEVHVDAEAVEFGPERYFATLRWHGRAQGSGIELDLHSYFVGRLEGDLIKEVWVFTDRDEARMKAGIEPE